MSATRKMEKQLGEIGYVFERSNSKGIQFWIHEEVGIEVKVPSGVTDSRSKSVIDMAKRAIGMPTCDNKRRPAEIRQRREDARSAAATARANLVRIRESGRSAELAEAIEAIEREERRFRYWDRMMRESAS